MTATHILEALAREYSSSPDHVHAVLEMLDAGLVPPLIGRFRRDRTGELPESTIRRIQRSRTDLEEMDRRRATVLRTLEGTEGVTEKELQVVRTTTDRFELEDMLLPHRRPEPEVQLALDRGLGELAALLVAPLPRQEEKEEQAETAAEPPTASDPGAEPAPPEGEPADGEQSTDDEAPAAVAPEAEAPEAEVSEAEVSWPKMERRERTSSMMSCGICSSRSCRSSRMEEKESKAIKRQPRNFLIVVIGSCYK